MKIVTVQEGSVDLPALLAQVQNGEEVVITRAGVPVARVTACRPRDELPAGIRVPGSWRSLPGWENFELDESVFAPMTDAEMEAEGWT